ncbi:hypothetical protein ACOSP7_031552 [Xanthoceras sorbifolium]
MDHFNISAKFQAVIRYQIPQKNSTLKLDYLGMAPIKLYQMITNCMSFFHMFREKKLYTIRVDVELLSLATMPSVYGSTETPPAMQTSNNVVDVSSESDADEVEQHKFQGWSTEESEDEDFVPRSDIPVDASDILPPLRKRKPGKPKKNRKRAPKEPRKLKRSDGLKCRGCGQWGHNIRTCKKSESGTNTSARAGTRGSGNTSNSTMPTKQTIRKRLFEAGNSSKSVGKMTRVEVYKHTCGGSSALMS